MADPSQLVIHLAAVAYVFLQLGVFGILVIGLALMLFSFYLQLMIAKSKDNLQLLLTLGYSPKWLGSSVVKTWLPVYISIIVITLLITALLHFMFINLTIVDSANLSWSLHWSVYLIALGIATCLSGLVKP